MTISLAWLRKQNSTEELVVASDSRVRFGGHWDCAPKVLQLKRGDSVLCFSGDTIYAYPVMLQALAAVEQHPKVQSGAYDLEDLKGYLIDVLNNMMSLVEDLPIGADPSPGTDFILAGWSWARGAFRAWLIHFDPNIKRFTFRPAKPWRGGNEDKFFVFSGDYEDDFKTRLVNLLRKRSKLDRGGFDMEPFEILRDMLRSGRYTKIGGAPQIVKVYKHANTLPFGILWPNDGSNRINVLGRPLLDYENTKYLILNPDSLSTIKQIELPVLADKLARNYIIKLFISNLIARINFINLNK